MEINVIGAIIYLFIGLVLSLYWFNKDYKKEHDELVNNEVPDRGVVNCLLIVMCIFWPIKLVGNFVKKSKKFV
jgi:hypothetical protein